MKGKNEVFSVFRGNGWTDFKDFGIRWKILIPSLTYMVYFFTFDPWGRAPARFWFRPTKIAIWQNEHVTLFEGNGWTDFNEVSGERYECPAAINVIWVITMPRPHGGQPQPVLLFFKTVLPSVGRKMKLGAAVEKTEILLRELDPL